MAKWINQNTRTTRQWQIYIIANAGMHLANKQGMTKLWANKPPPNCLPEAVQLPTITHTHLNLLMSRCCWDTQHKSSNLLDTAWEIEQNTDMRKKNVIIQNNVTNFLSRGISHGCMLPIWSLILSYLKTFDLFGWWISIWAKLFYALLNECVRSL